MLGPEEGHFEVDLLRRHRLGLLSMPIPLLPTPGSTTTTDEPTHLPSSPPPPGHDLFASQAWLLPCVSAVGRGVMQTLERPRNVDISNVLAPQLSAAAAHSIAVNKTEPPPNVTAPLRAAAAPTRHDHAVHLA